MLSREDRLEVIEMLKEGLSIVSKEQDEKTRQMMKESDEKTRQMMKESDEKTRQMMKESDEKTRHMIKETMKETVKIVKETVKETVKEVADYQTARFLKIFDSQQKMLERLDKLINKHDKKLDGMKDALDDE